MKTLGNDRLALEERIELVEEMWDSIAADSEAIPLTEAQCTELDRRIAEHDANPEDVVPWDEVRTQVSNGLKA